ncbi:polymerase small subunit VP39 [Eastern grey kangaroopox virus]|uniref:Cap-specific mRNA (nucleoside-2'-O-)-methyltransferase n=1 Tax=Eastern grey kangaroopox virus TaxID=2042482 RepID=A0A2C9DT42_9POXV|nr:polymerase small subunit VP39 [Eastern grey kangaroopox virus]ATI21175.1 polymerase small subunit VP39 [Eastern grey kangaroopox virus]ATX75080.1 poly(A) polymerase small subunit [Eastern grey kangaroopox virus]
MAGTVDLKKPFLYYDELTRERAYDARAERAGAAKFPSQGQLKLLLGELYFLNKLLKRNLLQDAVVVYIGSAPGRHIRYLRDHFYALNVRLRWVLIDGREHDRCLSGLEGVTILQRFVDEPYLHKLRLRFQGENVVLISDIRSMRGAEPTTDDLLRDYSLQNSMVCILKPMASSLKWRCPFPDQWVRDFYTVCGKEMLQPFAPAYSAELRLLTFYDRAPVRLRCVTLETAHEYEKRMFYLNDIVRRSIVLNFDYPRQEYDFYHMFHLLNTIVCPRKFSSAKKKVLFLQQSIFNYLRIRAGASAASP